MQDPPPCAHGARSKGGRGLWAIEEEMGDEIKSNSARLLHCSQQSQEGAGQGQQGRQGGTRASGGGSAGRWCWDRHRGGSRDGGGGGGGGRGGGGDRLWGGARGRGGRSLHTGGCGRGGRGKRGGRRGGGGRGRRGARGPRRRATNKHQHSRADECDTSTVAAQRQRLVQCVCRWGCSCSSLGELASYLTGWLPSRRGKRGELGADSNRRRTKEQRRVSGHKVC